MDEELMMFRLGKAAIILTLAACAWAPNTWAQQAAAPDPIEIARKSAEFLASRPAFSFNWFVSYDEIVDGRQKVTHLRSGSNLLARGKGFVSHSEREDGLRDYYYDGKVFSVSAPDDGFYASVDFDKGFEALIDAVKERTGSEIPLYTIMSADLPKGIGKDQVDAAYLGTVPVAGKEAYHLSFSDYDGDWEVWVSTDQAKPLPLLIAVTDPYKQGWPTYHAYLTDWDLNPTIDLADFTFTPAATDVHVSFPKLFGTDIASQPESGEGAAGADSGSGN